MIAVEKCLEEKRFGLTAGSFMLGRFINNPHPIDFWKSFTTLEIRVMINEWVLFEKYMKVLETVGEREINRAKKFIINEGLYEIQITAPYLKTFMTLKLSGIDLKTVQEAVTSGQEEQTTTVLDMLQKSYSAFYDFDTPWGVRELQKICDQEGINLPAAEST